VNQELRQRLLTQAAVDAERYPVDLEFAVASALVKVRRRFLLIRVVAIAAALVLTAGLVAWLIRPSGDPSDPPTTPAPTVSLESIAVTSPAQSLNVGTKVNLKAAGKYSDGSSRDLQAGLSWTSSNEAMATVSAEGLVTAVGPGPVTLTAAMEGISGSLGLSVASIKDPIPHSLTSLRVTPDSASMDPGGKQQLTAVGTYSDGTFATLNVEAVWDTSNRSVAPVDGNGLVTASREGSATITATLGGLQGAAAITVISQPKPVTGLSIDPAALTLEVGKQGKLTAVATYSDGTKKPVTNVMWVIDPKASAGKIATVDATGLVSATGPGTVTVTATLNGAANPVLSAAATISVTPQPPHVTSIVVTPSGPHNINVGQSLKLTAVVTYSDGSKDSSVVWSLGSPAQGKFPPGAPPRAVVTVSNSGLVSGRSGGQATVTASAGGVTSNAVAFTVHDVAK
jgi:uncharacterized protein YjdB